MGEGRVITVAGIVCAAIVAGTAWVSAGLSRTGTVDEGEACRDYQQYGVHKGAKVRILAGSEGVEAERMVRSFRTFERCTGIDVVWEGREDLESEVTKRLAAGTVPDLVVFNQPGQITAAARSKRMQPASAELTSRAIAAYPVQWLTYGTARSQFYAPPLGITVKSLVWFSPSVFRRRGWIPPQTWEQLRALTERIARETDVTPWCEGLQSGTSSGLQLTDWVEDVVLRQSGPDVYQQWIRHQVGFSDPPIRAAFDEVSWFLRDPDHVNRGFGGPASVATTPNNEAALPVLDGVCAMSRQPSTWVNRWPAGTEVARDGDVYAFPLPPMGPRDFPVLIGGEFAARFATTEAAEMTQRFMIDPTFTRLRAGEGGWISPSTLLRESWVPEGFDREGLRLLRTPGLRVHFDASDAMPDAVGSGSFWREGLTWVRGGSTQDVTQAIDRSWPR